MLFRSAAPVQDKVIASFANGRHAILEQMFGRGRVMAFCTAAGPPDNFLPANPAYPILLQEVLGYLAGNPDREVNLEIGQSFHQDVMVSTQHLTLRKPDGSKVRLTPVQTSKDQAATLDFAQTDQMGLYALDAPAEVVKRSRFVVNAQPTESNLDRIDEAEAARLVQIGRAHV